jgi:hypothetical protein
MILVRESGLFSLAAGQQGIDHRAIFEWVQDGVVESTSVSCLASFYTDASNPRSRDKQYKSNKP